MIAERAEDGGYKMGEGSQKAQTSSYKIGKSWDCNIQHDVYS